MLRCILAYRANLHSFPSLNPFMLNEKLQAPWFFIDLTISGILGALNIIAFSVSAVFGIVAAFGAAALYWSTLSSSIVPTAAPLASPVSLVPPRRDPATSVKTSQSPQAIRPTESQTIQPSSRRLTHRGVYIIGAGVKGHTTFYQHIKCLQHSQGTLNLFFYRVHLPLIYSCL
nr:unnamed protein product [Spirometra erinaceieuropaei]